MPAKDPKQRRATYKRWYDKHKKDHINSTKKWRKKNKIRHDYNSKKSRIKSLYGISIEEYNNWISSAKGRCQACHREVDKLHLDHNHVTGKVRGVLCFECNISLGHLKDSTERIEQLKIYLSLAEGIQAETCKVSNVGSTPTR